MRLAGSRGGRNASLVSSRLPPSPSLLQLPSLRSNHSPSHSVGLLRPSTGVREADGKKRRGESLTRGRRPLPDPTLPPPLPARPPRDRDYAQIKLGSLLRSDSARTESSCPRVCIRPTSSKRKLSYISRGERLSFLQIWQSFEKLEDIQSGRKVQVQTTEFEREIVGGRNYDSLNFRNDDTI